MKLAMLAIVRMMKWEIVVIAQSESAPGGVLCAMCTGRGRKRNQLFATKLLLSPVLSTDCFRDAKLPFSKKKVLKQGIFFNCSLVLIPSFSNGSVAKEEKRLNPLVFNFPTMGRTDKTDSELEFKLQLHYSDQSVIQYP